MLALLVLAGPGAGASPAGAAGWAAPFRIASPASLDVIPPQIAFSTAGRAAVAFGVQDVDKPSSSVAFATGPSAGVRPGRPLRVGSAQEILSPAYDGASLDLLAGTSPRGLTCCSSVQTIGSAGRGFGSPRELVGGLAGATVGQLVALRGGMLAAVATERGVWVSESAGGGPFGPARRLTPANAVPQALGATSLPSGQSIVAWTARTGQVTAPGPRTIFISRGSGHSAPGAPSAAVTISPGHSIDELTLAGRSALPTVAWIESWYDGLGVYHSQAVIADLTRTLRPRVLSLPGELASGLALAADARGDQAASWTACTSGGACTVSAVLRHAGGRFTPELPLGAADAGQIPAISVAPTGEALLGWIDQGHVLAAAAPPRGPSFSPAQTVSGTGFAADLTLSFGPAGAALAAWTQGTLAQSVMGAVYRG